MMHPGLVHESAEALPAEAAEELAEAAVEIATIEAEEHVETAEIYAATDEARIEAAAAVELAAIEAAEHIEIAAIEAAAEVAIAEEDSEVAIAEVVADAADGDGEEGGSADADELDDEFLHDPDLGDGEGAIAVAPPARIEPESKSSKPAHRSAFASRHQRTRRAS